MRRLVLPFTLAFAAACVSPRSNAPGDLAVAGSRHHAGGMAVTLTGVGTVIGGASTAVAGGVGDSGSLMGVGLAQVAVGLVLLIAGTSALDEGDRYVRQAHAQRPLPRPKRRTGKKTKKRAADDLGVVTSTVAAPPPPPAPPMRAPLRRE